MRLASLARRGGLLAVALLAAPGCVTPVGIDPGARARLKDEPAIHVIQYRPAAISVRTRLGDAVLSLNPYNPAPDSSRQDSGLTRDAGLTDPARRVEERFLASVTPELGLQNLQVVSVPPDSDDPEALRSRLPGGLALDFRTMQWLVRFDPNRLFSYYVEYLGRGRLIRLDRGEVIWQGFCHTPLPSQKEPSLEDLKANGGLLLRQKSDAEADRCASQLLDQFFGRTPPGG
jgi:hypothetical protein